MNTMSNYQVVILCTTLLFGNVSIAGEKIDQSLTVSDASVVAIENLTGQVTVIGWDKESVSVQGELDDKAERLVFEQVGNTINIKVELPHDDNWHTKGTNLTIHMPSTLRLNFEGVSCDIAINNLTNSVNVKTVSGDIEANKLEQHIELSSVSGNINTKDLVGKINLATVSGDIEDENSSGRLQLQAVSGEINSTSQANEVFVTNVSGNIQLSLDNIDELKISTVSGDSEVTLFLQDNGRVQASSVSGSVELDFQQDIAADFRLKANAGGDLRNKLTTQKAQRAKYGPSAKLYFQTGNGNGSVRVSTVSGDVTVK